MPTGYTPIYQVWKDGTDITGQLQERTVQVRVDSTSGRGEQDTCYLAFDDRDWLIQRPNAGDEIQIYLGYEEVGLAYMGNFKIEEYTFEFLPKTLTIKGNSQGNNAYLKSQSIKAFDGKTVGEILNEIGGKAGFQVGVHPDLRHQKVPYRNMVTSPQHMISQLEQMYGGIASIRDGNLTFVPQDKGEDADGSKTPIIVLQKEHLARWRVRHTQRTDYVKTRAAYRDAETGMRKWVESDSQVNVGADVGRAVGGALENVFTLGRLFASKEEAEAAGKSQMNALDRGLGEGDLDLVTGDPWIRGQHRLMINGTRDGIDGSYVIDLARHIYTKQTGLKTTLTFQPSMNGSSAYQTLYQNAIDLNLDRNNPENGFLIPEPGEVTGGVLKRGSNGRVVGGI